MYKSHIVLGRISIVLHIIFHCYPIKIIRFISNPRKLQIISICAFILKVTPTYYNLTVTLVVLVCF